MECCTVLMYVTKCTVNVGWCGRRRRRGVEQQREQEELRAGRRDSRLIHVSRLPVNRQDYRISNLTRVSQPIKQIAKNQIYLSQR
jgi:hypothetical protein